MEIMQRFSKQKKKMKQRKDNRIKNVMDPKKKTRLKT